ncbi:MAG: amino acid adenylation domain-containing protein [Xanthomonadales bacterium]|jgi:amino acid adenylation domain-containing protein|nr:amino acid adenylation domain-containing protein [Xanthomonadales bacterium]
MRPGPLERILALGQEQSDRPAILQDGQTLSYGELRESVLRLSAGIHRRGSEAGVTAGHDPVAVALAPSIDLVTTVLAVLHSGFPYLPLPLETMPASRREAIVADGAPWLILADRAGRAFYGEQANVQGLSDLLADARAAAIEEGTGLATDELGYVIYTSGSTGTPKGVEMRWGALANLVSWQVTDARLGKAARTAMLTPLTFDVSFQEIMGTLMTGGTLVVLDPELRRDSVSLARTLQRESVERLFLPFVALQALAEAANSFAAAPTALADIVTAGEQLKVTPEIVQFFESLQGAALHNHYGPAETHVVTVHCLRGEPRRWPELPPIGTPITGVEVLVMDGQGAEAAPGEPGELFLGGACLARGYRNLPEETRARFVPDPRPGATGILYRTGDLGRRREDGVFEWIGRSDDQVKIRGHRVEPGEVESVLNRHEGVRQIAVVPRRSGASHELIAYIRGEVPGDVAGEAHAHALETWRGVWDRTYGEASPERATPPDGVPEAVADPTFDTSGWNSSLTGERIPDAHMREWVDCTVERILAFEPRRVLEIGCGSGLLLHRVATHCEHYTGIDYSQAVIDQLSNTLDRQGVSAQAVSLVCAAAHEVADRIEDPVDLVVLNSVLQHFPSPAYLLDVLERAVAVTSPAGRIFIGDVTPRAFREAFFSWLEAPEAPVADTERAGVRERVQRRLSLDRELTLDPAFFDLLGAALPRVARVEVQVKRGRRRNELTDFRYDVTLHLDAGDPVAVSEDMTWSALDEASRTPEGLIRLVRSGARIGGVPNERTRTPWQRADELAGITGEADQQAVDPNELFDAADRLGIPLALRPETGSRTLTVAPAGAGIPDTITGHGGEDRPALLRRLAVHASNPLRDRVARVLVPQLRAFAEQELPEYMRPATYVLLDAFPRTSSGKIDRRQLPAPGHRRPELATSYAAPRTQLENTLAGIWGDVLALERIGIDDSFFELGGNSIGVVTVAARLTGELGREVPIPMLFEHPTVRTLAARLEAPVTAPSSMERGARGARTRAAYRHRRNRRVARG